jgi:hypothetical protein
MKRNSVNPVIGLYSELDEEFAHLLEIELIDKFGRRDLNKGPLLNLTDGGEGQTGLRHSDDTKQRVSAAKAGKPRPDEVRNKISIGNTGKPKSENHKIKLANANKGKVKGPISEEVRKKISDSLKGKPLSVEMKQQLSETMKIWHSNRKINDATQRANNE